MSVVGWWLLGDKVGESVVDSLCDGPVNITINYLNHIHNNNIFAGKNCDRSVVLDAFDISPAYHFESSIPVL